MAEPGEPRHEPARTRARPDGILPVSAAVLVGGESRRMGTDKAALVVGQETLVVRAVRTLASISDDVIVSCRHDDAMLDDFGGAARAVVDVLAGAGPLAGVASVLCAARHPTVVVVAVDMPFVAPELLRLVARKAIARQQSTVVRSPRGLEPLLAAYRRVEADTALTLLRAGERSMAAFLAATRAHVIEPWVWRPVDPAGTSFANWNRPDDIGPQP